MIRHVLSLAIAASASLMMPVTESLISTIRQNKVVQESAWHRHSEQCNCIMAASALRVKSASARLLKLRYLPCDKWRENRFYHLLGFTNKDLSLLVYLIYHPEVNKF